MEILILNDDDRNSEILTKGEFDFYCGEEEEEAPQLWDLITGEEDE